MFILPILLLTLGLSLTINSHAAGVRYGQTLCSDPAYRCMVTRNGDTWGGLWRNDREREVVMRLNRMNIELQPGTVIAVPKNLRQMSVMDISPFSYKIRPRGQKLINKYLMRSRACPKHNSIAFSRRY